MAESVKSNFVYNLINVISTLLFPLVTFPYVSRILMADGIGQVQFFNSIIGYVILFSSIGIPMYAIKEIARDRDDPVQMGRTTMEILLLHVILSIVGYLVVGLLCFCLNEIRQDIPLFLILSISILFTAVGCNWFYAGVEEFRFITLRGVLIKVLSLVFLFTFVNDKSDLYLYAIYIVIGTVGNGLINFFRLRKYIHFKVVMNEGLHPFRHLKPALSVFALNIISSIYLNLDSIMLGFLASSSAVGYYTAATRLTHMLLSVVTSLGTVLLPRLSNLIKNKKYDEFGHLAQKSCDFVFFLGLPIVFGLIIIAEPLIHVFSGASFDPAILTLRILSPIVVIIGMSNLIGIQILYPQNKMNTVLLCTGIGAVVNFVLNLLLIPRFQQAGAALATFAAETSVTASLLILSRRFIPFRLISRNSVKCVISCVIMSLVCIGMSFIELEEFMSFALIVVIGAVVYCLVLSLLKEQFVNDGLFRIKEWLHERV